MHSSRRQFLRMFMGAGSVGLASLATGLPIALLANPRRALADGPMTCPPAGAAQFLIMSTSGNGDPVNANVPGAYVTDRGHSVVHAADPSMAATQFMVGTQRVTGAQVWSTLPANVLARTCFFHHATYTNSHPNEFKVLELMGSTAYSESIPSIYAKSLQSCLGTIQAEPVVVSGANGVVAFNGRPLASLSPVALKETLTRDMSAVNSAALVALRDRHLDNVNAVLRQGATRAQRDYVDALVHSRQQARAIPQELLSTLASITSNDAAGQCTAAIALIKMRVSPAVIITIPFGGDNHTDDGLMDHEVPDTQAGVTQIGQLMTDLGTAGLADAVTFAMLNVFGRTPSSQGTTGRGHWANHHAGIVISSKTRGGVVGGMEWSDMAQDFVASSIDPATGAASASGSITMNTSLQSFAKTLGRTLGVPQDTLDMQIMGGTTVAAALA